jgi:DNA-directed RNA polymerase specialized sigma24 family protein
MMPPAGDRRSVSAVSFGRLLEALHADPDEAAHEYERIRRTLVKFFDWRGIAAPDECADEVFDRLARKLEDTTVGDVRKYVHGIARLVALERRRGPVFASIDDVSEPSATATASSDPGHPLQDCFERCLDALPADSRSLLLRYYEGERQTKISNRRRLATMLGVTENGLRSRVQRLRDRLEQCVHACAAQPVSHLS